MTQRPIILGQGPSGPLEIDLDRLIETRLLIQGSSGSGKSRAVRRLLEQTHGRVQQIVLDVEDEYASLRERFDVVLGGPGRDFPIEVRSAALLARRLLELGASAVLNIHELEHRARGAFVKAFLDALLAAPQALWHDALVVVEEADTLAREGTRGSEATDAIAELMGRGRKRGFCGICACRRISDVAKSVVALAQNRLIGQTTLDADVKRAAYELGFSGRTDGRKLVELPQGSFYAFGPALSREVTLVRVGEVETSHGRQRGKRAPAPPPPPAAVREMLAKLADLPAEAAREAQDLLALQTRVRELEKALRAARAGGPSPEDLERARADGARAAEQQLRELAARLNGRHGQAAQALERAVGELGKVGHLLRDPAESGPIRPTNKIDDIFAPICAEGSRTPTNPCTSARRDAANASPVVDRSRRSSGSVDTAPSQQLTARSGQLRMLQVLAQLSPAGVTEGQWRSLAGLKRGGTWDTYKSRLRMAGQIERRADGLFYATDEGVREAGVVPSAPSNPEELIEMWRGKPGMRQAIRLAETLMLQGPMTRDALAAAVGLTRGGTFDAYLSRCRSAGLIRPNGDLVEPAAVLLG